MSTIQIPDEIVKLCEISENLWWSWTPVARDMFRHLDYPLWTMSNHNPKLMLKLITKERLDWAANDEKFKNLYARVVDLYNKNVLKSSGWFHTDLATPFSNPVAYFSMEFGLHPSIPIYSGGLGVLAGDICKQASDLGIPFVGIGFFYQQGYFTQVIPAHGWQEAQFHKIDIENISISPVTNKDNERIKVSVALGDDIVNIQAWEIRVGQNKMFLLDTDIVDNKPWYRGLSSRLYGGDHEMRLNQEIVLGFGGVRLLEKLGISPSIWHLNEGHCSFVSLERLRKSILKGANFETALASVRKTTIFTTHTPVPAGHDKFDLSHIVDKFNGMWEDLDVSKEDFLSLGIDQKDENPKFNMTVLGFKTAHMVNGVSKLHLEVSKEMWKGLLENGQTDTELIGVTNGVHVLTWISGPMRRVFNKFIDPMWARNVDTPDLWKKVSNIPDREFWLAHNEAKYRLFSFMREKARDYRIRAAMDSEQILGSGTFLDPDALTIGFARRFATYKRANLIFRDIKRLQKILNNSYKPVQIIFAGKAHPADEEGKYMIQQIYEQALEVGNAGRIAFIENYDMHIARFLVQGVDIWLNNPIRPYEASGTSGIKASINGIPHFSILDGWWGESYNGKNGWVIGNETNHMDAEERDQFDSESLYDTLENEIVPAYYRRDANGIPVDWITICKEAISTVAPQFSASRMVKDYVNKMYLKSI